MDLVPSVLVVGVQQVPSCRLKPGNRCGGLLPRDGLQTLVLGCRPWSAAWFVLAVCASGGPVHDGRPVWAPQGRPRLLRRISTAAIVHLSSCPVPRITGAGGAVAPGKGSAGLFT
jgi:hypothetical protein